MMPPGSGVLVLRRVDGVTRIIHAANMRDVLKQHRYREWRDATIVGVVPVRNVGDAHRVARKLRARFLRRALVMGRADNSRLLFLLTENDDATIVRYARFVQGARERDLGGGVRRRLAQLARKVRHNVASKSAQFPVEV